MQYKRTVSQSSLKKEEGARRDRDAETSQRSIRRLSSLHSGSVGESLIAFMAATTTSRGCSAVRSSGGVASDEQNQAREQAPKPQTAETIPQRTNQKPPSGKNEAGESKRDSFQKYLRRPISSNNQRQAQRQVMTNLPPTLNNTNLLGADKQSAKANMTITSEDMKSKPGLTVTQTPKASLDQKAQKEKRAQSQHAKQVSFDIKEGLRGIMVEAQRKEEDEYTNINVHSARLNKYLQRKYHESEEFLPLQQAEANQHMKIVSNDYNDGAEQRGQKPDRKGNSNKSSSRKKNRLAQIPTSEQKAAFELALQYKKESLEKAMRQGHIQIQNGALTRDELDHDHRKITSSLSPIETRNNRNVSSGEVSLTKKGGNKIVRSSTEKQFWNEDAETLSTPQTNRIKPPNPQKITCLHSDRGENYRLSHDFQNPTLVKPNIVEQKRRANSQASHRVQKRAGTIVRTRDISLNKVEDNRRSCESSRQQQIVKSDCLNVEKRNQKLGPGQIVRVSASQEREMMTINKQNQQEACHLNQNLQDNQLTNLNRQTGESEDAVTCETGQKASPPSFALQSPENPRLNDSQRSNLYVETTQGKTSRVASNRVPIAIDMQFLQASDAQNMFQLSLQKQEQSQVATSRDDLVELPYTSFNMWDLFQLTPPEFEMHMQQFQSVIENSKRALHEPLRTELLQAQSQGQDQNTFQTSLYQSIGSKKPLHVMVQQRLKLLRKNLKVALMDSFHPLIYEIIQLKERLEVRKRSLRLSVKQPLKAAIIKDICSRLQQKLVIKVLYMRCQYRRNLVQLFNAYFDLLVRKNVLSEVFGSLRHFKQYQIEKQIYLNYARTQIADVKKTQMFDNWKRFKFYIHLEAEKKRQIISTLTKRTYVRIVTVWKQYVIQRRAKALCRQIVEAFRVYKRRDQILPKLLFTLKQEKSVKMKAIKQIQRHERNPSNNFVSLTESSSESTIRAKQILLQESSYCETDDDSCKNYQSFEIGTYEWLQKIIQRTEEQFFAKIQDWLLEKEHCQTIIRRLSLRLKFNHLSSNYPLFFDKSQNGHVWNIPQSQAFLSNKEQIYTAFPELAPKTKAYKVPAISTKPPKHAVNPSFNNSEASYILNVADENMNVQNQQIKQSCEEKDVETSSIWKEEKFFKQKYAIHQALVAQQNFHLKSIQQQLGSLPSLQSSQGTPGFTRRNPLHYLSLQSSLGQADDRPDSNLFQNVNSSNTGTLTIQPQVSFQTKQRKQRRKTSKQGNTEFSSLSKQSKKAPNQLFMKLQKQIEDRQAETDFGVVKPSGRHNKPYLTPEQHLSVKMQFETHLRDSIAQWKKQLAENHQAAQLDGSSNVLCDPAMLRAKSMAYVSNKNSMKWGLQMCKEGNTNQQEISQSDNKGMSLTDFTQVAMNRNLKFAELNQAKLMFKMLSAWRQALRDHAMLKDLDMFRGYRVAKTLFKSYRQQSVNLFQKAQTFQRTKEVENFYMLFKKWQKGNRQLMYMTEKRVRQFRQRFILEKWRQVGKVIGAQKKIDVQAIELYVRALQSKALASLYQNQMVGGKIAKFKRRTTLLKFFKRKWLVKTRARMLLRKVFSNQLNHEKAQGKSLQVRKLEQKRSCFVKWRRRVEELRELVNKYMALTHYKTGLLFKSLYVLKQGPIKKRACLKLRDIFMDKAVRPSFEILVECCQENLYKVNKHVQEKTLVFMQKIMHQWHTIAVKQKIANLFFQRKYLYALRIHIQKKNWKVPFAFRKHTLQMKALTALKFEKLQNHLLARKIYQADLLCKSHKMSQLRRCLQILRQHVNQRKRDRLIQHTVQEFRRHVSCEKAFKVWKLYRMQRRRRTLMKQVADEFYNEKIQRQIEEGRVKVSLCNQRGILLNENQHLLINVLTEWRHTSRWLHRHGFRLEHMINSKRKLTQLRVFLSWKQIAKYETSARKNDSKLRQKVPTLLPLITNPIQMTLGNKSKAEQQINNFSPVNDYIQVQEYQNPSARPAQYYHQQPLIQEMQQFKPITNSKHTKSASELKNIAVEDPHAVLFAGKPRQYYFHQDSVSYINTDDDSTAKKRMFAANVNTEELYSHRVEHNHMDSQALILSLVNTESNQNQFDSSNGGQQIQHYPTHTESSDSTLNQRAPPSMQRGQDDRTTTTFENRSSFQHIVDSGRQQLACNDLRYNQSIESVTSYENPAAIANIKGILRKSSGVQRLAQAAIDYATFSQNEPKNKNNQSIGSQFTKDEEVSNSVKRFGVFSSVSSSQRHSQAQKSANDYATNFFRVVHNHDSVSSKQRLNQQQSAIHQTISIGTDPDLGQNHSLQEELESIFKHNVVWQDEQNQRESILQKMAEYYQTNISTIQHTNSLTQGQEPSQSEEDQVENPYANPSHFPTGKSKRQPPFLCSMSDESDVIPLDARPSPAFCQDPSVYKKMNKFINEMPVEASSNYVEEDEYEVNPMDSQLN